MKTDSTRVHSTFLGVCTFTVCLRPMDTICTIIIVLEILMMNKHIQFVGIPIAKSRHDGFRFSLFFSHAKQ